MNSKIITNLLRRKISFKQLFLSICLIVFIYISANIILTAIKVQQYTFVSSPNEFLKNFEEQGMKTEIELECDFGQLVCFNSHVVSPLFPHQSLKFYARIKKGTGKVFKYYTIRKDKIWNVFWVQDHNTNSYWGPYRSNFKEKMDIINLP